MKSINHKRSRPFAFWQSKTLQERAIKYISFFLLAFGSFLVLTPFAWMISLSLRNELDVLRPNWIPDPIVWTNFSRALFEYKFTLYVRNTVVITVFCVLGSLLSASLAGFGFARTRFPGRDFLFSLVLATMMVPYTVTMVPQFIIFRTWGWIDTYLPLIVPTFFGGIPFFIFLMRQFFFQIPRELDEAARLDGCNFFGIYWRIGLPLAKPPLITVAILGFVWEWNNLVGPLIYINSMEKRTVALAMTFFRSEFAAHSGLNMIMAIAILFIIPPLFVFFVAQRYYVQGVTFSGLKG